MNSNLQKLLEETSSNLLFPEVGDIVLCTYRNIKEVGKFIVIQKEVYTNDIVYTCICLWFDNFSNSIDAENAGETFTITRREMVQRTTLEEYWFSLDYRPLEISK